MHSRASYWRYVDYIVPHEAGIHAMCILGACSESCIAISQRARKQNTYACSPRAQRRGLWARCQHTTLERAMPRIEGAATTKSDRRRGMAQELWAPTRRACPVYATRAMAEAKQESVSHDAMACTKRRNSFFSSDHFVMPCIFFCCFRSGIQHRCAGLLY